MRISLAGVLSVIFFTAFSQDIIPRFETLGVNEGLSQNSVYAVYQDKRGYMWFGTADGLNRYDGDEIKVFKIETGLKKKGNSNFIRSNLCEDDQGNIWFSTETGIYYCDRMVEQLKLAYSFPELKAGIIYYLLLGIDSDQTLWFSTKYIGVASWQIKSRTWTSYKYPFKVDLNRLPVLDYATTVSNENIWFAWYRNDGMYKFNTREKKYEHIFSGKNYLTICFGKGEYFLTNENSIYRYDSATALLDSFPITNYIKGPNKYHSIYRDSYKRLWICSFDQGLFYFDLTTRKLHHYQHNTLIQKSLASDFVRQLVEDKSGNLWIGTDGGGVSKLDLKPPLFNLFPQNEGEYPVLKDYFIKCFFEDEQSRIWFGTNNGFNIYDPSDGNLKHFSPKDGDPNSLPGNVVSAIFRDKERNIWIGHNRGISIFNESRRTFRTVPLHLFSPPDSSSSFVYRIIQLKNGDLMAATSRQLVLIKRNSKGNYTAT